MNRHSSQSENFHIPQRETSDCVIATIATIANMPYESVAKLSPRKPGTRGLYPHQVRRLLQSVTQIKWNYARIAARRGLRSYCDSDETLVLLIRQPGNPLLQWITRKKLHCIFVREGDVYDPEYSDVIHVDDYDRINWVPALALSPADAQKLEEIQAENYTRYRTERLWSEIKGG